MRGSVCLWNPCELFAMAAADGDAPSRPSTATLLDWLASEGAELGRIRLGRCADKGGVGVFAAKDLASGSNAFQCPCNAVLSADAARADACIGEALRSVRGLTDENLVVLMLLHARQQGSASRHHAYVSSLPNDDDLQELLPLHWPIQQQQALFGGTPLLLQCERMLAKLREFHTNVVIGQLLATFPTIFHPPEAYTFERLCWASAAWSSRAILLDLPGGARRTPVNR